MSAENLSFPAIASISASPSGRTQTEANQLSEEVRKLQAQIAASQKIAQETRGFQFAKNLKLGDRGEDVRKLQRVLNTNLITQVSYEGPGSTGNESDYFGQKTKEAIIRFQDAYALEILFPFGLFGGTGFVGPATRKKLNELGKDGFPVGVLVVPVIESISPTRGPIGTKIVITGNWFSEKNTILTEFEVFKNIPSVDGRTLEITLNEIFYEGLGINSNMNISGDSQDISIIKFLKDFLAKEGFQTLNEAIHVSQGINIIKEKIPATINSMPVHIFVVNKNGTSNPGIFNLEIDFRKDFFPIHSTEEVIPYERGDLFYEMKEKVNKTWMKLKDSLVKDATVSTSEGIIPFKGQILFSVPCFCNGSFALAIKPVHGPSGIYQVPIASLKKFWLPVPPQWVVGGALPKEGICSLWLIWCFEFETQYVVPPTPGIGTSSFVPNN